MASGLQQHPPRTGALPEHHTLLDKQWLCYLTARGRRGAGAVDVQVEPAGVAALPQARLLGAAAAWPALGVHVLRQPDVGDAGGVGAQQVDVGVEEGGVDRPAALTQPWDTQTPPAPVRGFWRQTQRGSVCTRGPPRWNTKTRTTSSLFAQHLGGC